MFADLTVSDSDMMQLIVGGTSRAKSRNSTAYVFQFPTGLGSQQKHCSHTICFERKTPAVVRHVRSRGSSRYGVMRETCYLPNHLRCCIHAYTNYTPSSFFTVTPKVFRSHVLNKPIWRRLLERERSIRGKNIYNDADKIADKIKSILIFNITGSK